MGRKHDGNKAQGRRNRRQDGDAQVGARRCTVPGKGLALMLGCGRVAPEVTDRQNPKTRAPLLACRQLPSARASLALFRALKMPASHFM